MIKDTHGDLKAYDLAKQCNVLMALELDRREADHGVRAFSLHPGTLIPTDIGRRSAITRFALRLIRPFTPSVAQGAALADLA